MRRNTLRPSADPGASSRLASLFNMHQERSDRSAQSQSSYTSSPRSTRRRRRPASVSAFVTSAAILVSSVLVSSPAMIAPVGATYLPSDSSTSSSSSVSQYALAPNQVGKQQPLLFSGIPSDSQSATSNKILLPRSSAYFTSSQQTRSQPCERSTASLADIDDHLPPEVKHDATLHRQYVRQYDDESALFGERDVSMMTHSPQIEKDISSSASVASNNATQSAHRYSLPSTYPSSIASSWSRPERSVWFQQKAIIITSIFLAIFIVLFIGAAVFLRERKFDDELADLDDEEALARIEERMTMGRFNDPNEKDSSSPSARTKRRFRLGRKRSERHRGNPDLPETSSGSSSGVRRKRHLVSRWTRTNLRDSNDTMRGTSDTASIRSGRSARHVALGHPRAQESVEIMYDGQGAEIPRTNGEFGDTTHTGMDVTSGSTGGPATANDDIRTAHTLANRPRSPPPPHPDRAQRHTDVSSEGRSPSNPDTLGINTLDSEGSLRSPRRILLDDSDFQAADAAETHHEDMRHMPPAYIPSGSGGMSGSSYDAAVLAAALARGDAKHGIPPPEERDSTVSPEVISAALANAAAASSDTHESTGPTTAHIATDDKAVLGAISAAASMPSAPAVDRETCAPAYGTPEESAAGGSSSSGAQVAAISGPSAPVLEVDGDEFEVAPAEAAASGSTTRRSIEGERHAGKGKAKQVQVSSILPAPPVAIETAFSPFDQPYRAAGPPGTNVPPSTPGRVAPLGRRSGDTPAALMTPRKSEKQREAEQDELAHLVASRPDGMDVPRYERLDTTIHEPSAPPLAEAEDSGTTGDTTEQMASRSTEHLPAYEQRRRSPAAAAQLALTSAPAASAPRVDQPNSSAPSAPSAPSMDGEEQ